MASAKDALSQPFIASKDHMQSIVVEEWEFFLAHKTSNTAHHNVENCSEYDNDFFQVVQASRHLWSVPSHHRKCSPTDECCGTSPWMLPHPGDAKGCEVMRLCVQTSVLPKENLLIRSVVRFQLTISGQSSAFLVILEYQPGKSNFGFVCSCKLVTLFVLSCNV